MTSLVNLIVYSSSAERPCFAKANCASDVSRASASAPNVRVTYGSRVRRSLPYIFLIDEESSTDAEKILPIILPRWALEGA